MTKYLENLFRHSTRFFLLFVVIPVALSAFCVYLFPTKQAAADLWVDQPSFFGVSTATTSGWNQYLTPAQNTADGLNQLTKTATYVHQLAARLDSTHIWRDRTERSDMLGTVSTALHIAQNGSHLVSMDVTCRRAAVCVAVLSVTIDIYRQSLSAQGQQQSKAAAAFYQGEINQALTKLNSDQDALSSYLNRNPQLQAGDEQLVPEFGQLTSQVTQDQNNLATLQQKLDSIQLTANAADQVNNSVLRVIDPPAAISGGRFSSLPKTQLSIVWAACVGLGVGWLLLLAWVDRTARDSRDLERLLRVPVVTEIRLMPAGERL